ncbi:thaumatin family protein [Francisellaceae bacterium]|nr:thaumatin family protein [Francisellaceae bacterium]
MNYLNIMKKICPKVFIFGLALSCSQLGFSASSPNSNKSITITNKTGQTNTFYFMVDKISKIPDAVVTQYKNLPHPCVYPKSVYSGQGNALTCHLSLDNNQSQKIPLDGFSQTSPVIDVSAGEGHYPLGPCNTTVAEFTLNSGGYDHYDVSLVNGQNYNVKVVSSNANATTIDLKSNNLSEIKKTLGVFPPGCTICVHGGKPAPVWKGNSGPPATQNCPAYPFRNTGSQMPSGSCKGGTESKPTPNVCQLDSEPVSQSYTVTFSEINADMPPQ